MKGIITRFYKNKKGIIKMETIIYEKETLKNIAIGVRVCVNSMIENSTPYSCSIKEDEYWQYVSNYKSEIINFLPVNYLCMKHQHKDTYIHCADLDILHKIIEEGCLKRENSSELCTLGPAIYTYPLRSGMFFYKNTLNSEFLVFDADNIHYHIVQTDDTPCCIGEANFLCDELKIENPRILTYSEIEKMSKDFFDGEYAKQNYFGLNCEENATNQNKLFKIIEHYNYSIKKM